MATSACHGVGGFVVSQADGSELTADLVLSAVGLRPIIARAKGAGLQTQYGDVIDGFGQTSASGIYPRGDCAE